MVNKDISSSVKLDNAGIRLRIEDEFEESLLLGFSEFRSLLSIDIRGSDVGQFASFCLRELNFPLLVDITAVDYSTYKHRAGVVERFGVIYIFYSFVHSLRIKLRAFVSESSCTLPSICSEYKGALWTEREVYDMYGIVFSGHPDLKRLLMPDDFVDHPLRKDYPLRGKGERTSFPKYNIHNRVRED